jgi:hypothetical protein
MGPPDRFEWYVTTMLGLGISYFRFPYEHFVVIDLPFVRFCCGFGRSYIDPLFKGGN